MQLRGAMLMKELHRETWERRLEKAIWARCETVEYMELVKVESDNMSG
jgi:hypothetical protein